MNFGSRAGKGAVVKSKTVIIATGARWRNVNVPGEKEFKNKAWLIAPTATDRCLQGRMWP